MKYLILNFLSRILPASLNDEIRRWPFRIRRYRRILRRKPHTILFYPDPPQRYPHDYVIPHLFRLLGYSITNNPSENYQFIVRWEDTTFGSTDEQIKKLMNKSSIINIRCLDISKKHVDSVFKEVFGYSSLIDPFTYHGLCVDKSDINALHDGMVVQCPIPEIKEDRVYQKLIDNRFNDHLTCEYRVPVLKESIPFVYIKYKLLNDRFGFSVNADLVETDKAFSNDELKNIIAFCHKIGLDLGELDIIRDRSDGKIYIVDVNNTPTIWFAGFTEKETSRILRRYSRAFEEMLSSL